MKIKVFFLSVFFSVLYGSAYSQDTPDAYKDRINYIFANVDHSKVTTGLLSDYGLQIIPPEYYYGTLLDSNEVDIDVFRTLYADMDNSRFNSNCALPIQSTVFNAITSNMPVDGQPVPIASMFISYNSYRTDAYTTGLVTVTNEQIFDVTGENPYQTNVLFAASPISKGLSCSSTQFVLKSALYYTNVGKTITTIAADMGDGSGFRTIAWDAPFSITYPSPGNKVFVIKFTFSDGTMLQTHGKIVVDYSLQLKSASGYYYYTEYSPSPNPFVAGSGHSGGTVTVRFGSGHSDRKIHKPLIVSEGFDPWKIISPDNSEMNLTIDDFLGIIKSPPAGHIDVPLSSGQYLGDYLFSQGYDIVYLDNSVGTDDIKRNATLLEEVIKWVNTQKQANGSTEPNVVMGISMGGLVARYALRQLEMQGYNHQTKIYISMDSPHNGANIPVGAQAALYHAKNFGFSIGLLGGVPGVTIHPGDYIDELNHFYTLLNTPAAKQMLFYKVTSTSGSLAYDNSVHQSFMSEYQSMGFPQNCYNVAISDGSGTGAPIVAAGATFIGYSTSYRLKWWMDLITNVFGGVFLYTSYPELAVVTTFPGSTQVKAEVSVNATPVTPGRIYHGRVYVKKKILWFIPVTVDITNTNFNSISSMYPIDGAPGGIYDLNEFTDLSNYPSGAIQESKFCFVPAVSSLALNNWSTYFNSNLNNYNFISNGETNFQEYFRPMTAVNNLHTSFSSSDSDRSLADFIKTTLDNLNGYCTTTTIIQNLNYTQSQTIVGCNLNIQNVIVQNNSSVTFDATYNTLINGPFEVQLGSSIVIK